MAESRWTDEQIRAVLAERCEGKDEIKDLWALARLVLDAREEIARLRSHRMSLDCRYTMGDVADVGGRHCDKPCARCAADEAHSAALARAEKAEAERDEARTALSDAGVGGIDHHCGKGGGA